MHDYAADVVGQSAVGVRNVMAALFYHQDFRGFVNRRSRVLHTMRLRPRRQQ